MAYRRYRVMRTDPETNFPRTVASCEANGVRVHDDGVVTFETQLSTIMVYRLVEGDYIQWEEIK